MDIKPPHQKSRQYIIEDIRNGLVHTPVARAWLFGSFARREETDESDIDLLVQFMPNARPSLFDFGGIVYDLEERTGRRIDLVQDNMLKPFARPSAEKDKILIYERETEGQ